MKQDNLEKFLNKVGRKVVSKSKENLNRSKGSTKLASTIKYKIVESGGSLDVAFSMADYGTFVDKGVKGKGGTIPNGKYKGSWNGRRHYITNEGKRKDSPYKFGSGRGRKGGLRKGIASFVRKKGIQPRTKGGKYASPKGLIYVISRNIYIRGIHGISFFQKALGIGMKGYAEGVSKAIAKDIQADIEEQNKQKK
tara:strand:+ start:136 stop:720 length:585 start_codon:yes stop_codon:yes gene_type:complete